MKNQETILRTLFIILSACFSFAFVFYGLNLINARGVAKGLTVFGYVTAGYGLANIAVLSLAWNSREPWAKNVSMLITFCYLGIFIMDKVKTGIGGMLEIVGILVLAVVLWCNWFAVKKAVERP